MRKLPAKYNFLLMPFIVTFFMTCMVSAVSILKSYGFGDEFMGKWITAWMTSWVVAFPALLVILPNVKKLLEVITE